MAACHPVAEKSIPEQKVVAANLYQQQNNIRKPTINTLLARMGAILQLSTVVYTK